MYTQAKIYYTFIFSYKKEKVCTRSKESRRKQASSK